jgi:transposase
MIHFVGLDVHRREIQACIQDRDGNILSEHRLQTTREALEEFAQRYLSQSTSIALEATLNTWAIARLLQPKVGRLVVSNPLQTKAIAAAKVKTDKVDARVLCHLLRCDYLPPVWMPDEGTQRLRTLTHRRASLVSERTRLKNRIHSVLAQAMIPLPVKDLFSDKGLRWLKELTLQPLERDMIESDQRLLQSTEAEMQRLDKQIAVSAYDDPRARMLMTLIGVDYPIALTVLAALGDISRFRDGDHAAAYLGLVPSTHQSADHCYHGPITKRGSGKARWMLIQAAQKAADHPGPLGVFFRRLHKRKNRNIAVVATARKLVVIAWHILTKNEPYRYALPLPTQTKLARLRVKATGKKRKTGTAKGTPQPAHRGTGQSFRRIPALPALYREEGLPTATPA